MNVRTPFAALLAGTALASPALCADLPVKAPPAPVTAVAPVFLDEWSGIYVGLEAGFGWGRQNFDAVSIGGFGGGRDIADVLNGGSSVLFPEFTGLGIGNSISQNGGLFGGFAGVQKQMGNWVLGLETDFDGSGIKGSSTSFTVQNGVTVSSLFFDFPTSNGNLTIPGQSITSTGTLTIPGQSITSTGDVNIPAQTVQICKADGGCKDLSNARFSVQVPAQNVPVTVKGNTTDVNVNVTVNGSTQTVTLPIMVMSQQLFLRQVQATTNVSRSVSIDSKVDELGSARGKIGFAVVPNFLLYGTGGLAFAHKTDNVVATESFTADFNDGNGPQHFSHTSSTSGGVTMLGWAVGAGVDWKWTGTNWIFGIEYLHYEFPKHTINLSDGAASVTFVNSRESVDAVKGRISYLFPIH